MTPHRSSNHLVDISKLYFEKFFKNTKQFKVSKIVTEYYGDRRIVKDQYFSFRPSVRDIFESLEKIGSIAVPIEPLNSKTKFGILRIFTYFFRLREEAIEEISKVSNFISEHMPHSLQLVFEDERIQLPDYAKEQNRLIGCDLIFNLDREYSSQLVALLLERISQYIGWPQKYSQMRFDDKIRTTHVTYPSLFSEDNETLYWVLSSSLNKNKLRREAFTLKSNVGQLIESESDLLRELEKNMSKEINPIYFSRLLKVCDDSFIPFRSRWIEPGVLDYSAFQVDSHLAWERVCKHCDAFAKIDSLCSKGIIIGHDAGFAKFHLLMGTKNGRSFFKKTTPGWDETDRDSRQLDHSENRSYSPWSCHKLKACGLCPLKKGDFSCIPNGKTKNPAIFQRFKETKGLLNG